MKMALTHTIMQLTRIGGSGRNDQCGAPHRNSVEIYANQTQGQKNALRLKALPIYNNVR